MFDNGYIKRNFCDDEYLMRYGMPRHSGRYPWGFERNFCDDLRYHIEDQPNRILIIHDTPDPCEVIAEMYFKGKLQYFSWRLFSDEHYEIFDYSPDEMTNEQRIDQFRLRLKRVMRENCLMTQTKLSQLTGISQSALSRYLYTDTLPSLDNFFRIAHALNCPLDRFEYRFTNTYEWAIPENI